MNKKVFSYLFITIFIISPQLLVAEENILLTPIENIENIQTIKFDDSNRVTSVGSPVQFHIPTEGSTTQKSFEYKWSMGDGFIAYGEVVEHMYSFSGDYVVVLTVSNGPKIAVHRINVRVVEPQLSARHIQDGIEIKNNGKDQINLYRWLISAGNVSYNIPADLIIMPSKSIVLDALISKLPDSGDITVTNAEGQVLPLLNFLNSPGTEKNIAAISGALIIEHNESFLGRIRNFVKQFFIFLN